jgi:hypothetical protein
VLRFNADFYYINCHNVERQNVDCHNVERQNVDFQNVECHNVLSSPCTVMFVVCTNVSILSVPMWMKNNISALAAWRSGHRTEDPGSNPARLHIRFFRDIIDNAVVYDCLNMHCVCVEKREICM